MAKGKTGQKEATEEVAAEEVQPVVLPPKAEELVNQAVSSIPELSPHLSAVEAVFVCYTTYVGSEEIPVIPTEPATALMELGLARGWTAGDISQACDDVEDGLTDAWQILTGDFNAATAEMISEEVSGLKFDLAAGRYTAERQEQDGLTKRSRELLDSVKTVSGQLGIPNPDAGPPTAPPPPSRVKVVTSALAIGLRQMASPIVIFSEETEAEAPPPSWRTSPIIVDEDPDIRTLEDVVARRAASQVDVQLILAGLETLGLPKEKIAELLGRVAKKAREQIAQSEEIMRNVAASYGQFSDRLEAIQRMVGIAVAVRDFFFPKEAKAA